MSINKSWLCHVVCMVACVGLAVPAPAGLVNGGFETGNLDGWTITARDVTRYGMGGTGSPPLPIEGDWFAVLCSDVSPWTTLSQEVSMGVGDTLEGYAWFDRYIASEAEAYVRVYDSLGTLVATSWANSTERSTAWEPWTFTASSADTYRLVLGITEPSAQTFHLQAFFDGVVYTDNPGDTPSGIPAPGAALLAAIGAGIVGRVRRRLA
ncbi:MAG: hypothetical protein KBE65_22700 [Phycisphaerae bacterium]|nr:hypothetical protein [Phycisphaerae bacterium]